MANPLAPGQGPGTLLFVIRFLIYVPCFFFGINAASQYTSRQKHPLPAGKVVHGDIIQLALGLIGVPGAIAIPWNFIAWLPSALLHEGSWYGFFTFALIDSTLTACMAAGLHLAKQFLPGTSPAACTAHAATWQMDPPPSPGMQNLFVYETVSRRLMKDKKDKTNPIKVCKDLLYVWRFGLAITFFQGLLAFTTLCGLFVMLRHKSPHPWTYLTAPIRFSSRAFQKWRAGRREQVLEETGSTAAGDGEKDRSYLYFQVDYASKPPRHHSRGLENLLSSGQYIVLSSMAEHLHAHDLLNLACVSKRTWNAVTPHVRVLKHMACGGEAEDECWGCGIRVCESCTKTVYLPELPTILHATCCRPACTKCYITQICLSVASSKNKCSCAPIVNASYPHIPSPNATPGAEVRLACPSCATYKHPERLHTNFPIESNTSSTVQNQKKRSLNPFKRSTSQPATTAPIPLHYYHPANKYIPAAVLMRHLRLGRHSHGHGTAEGHRRRGRREEGETGIVSSSSHCGRCERKVDRWGLFTWGWRWGPRWWVCTTCWRECVVEVHSSWGSGLRGAVGGGRGGDAKCVDEHSRRGGGNDDGRREGGDEDVRRGNVDEDVV